MDLASINSNTAAVQGANRNPGSGSLGKDDFLQLLVTQLRNQDPVNPMESAEFASQLAQFNSVEQLINVNDSIEALAQQQASTSTGLINTMASTLSGKTVKVQTNQFGLGSEGSTEIGFKINNPAGDVEIRIFNESGELVRTEKLKNFNAGEHTYTWDGKSDSGRSLEEGTYRVEVSAKDGDTNIPASTFLEGVVDRVKFSNSGVKLLVNGVDVGLGDVEEIGESPQ